MTESEIADGLKEYSEAVATLGFDAATTLGFMIAEAFKPLTEAVYNFSEEFKKVFPYYWRVRTKFPERAGGLRAD